MLFLLHCELWKGLFLVAKKIKYSFCPKESIMEMLSMHGFRDVLLNVDWALLSFFLVKLTPFEFLSGNILKNIGGITLFAIFIILFEIFGKDFLWTLVGKHERIGKQILFLAGLLVGFAVLFSFVA